MILACNNISKSFIDKSIIQNASFHIEEHEKAAIVGINGAGKSTLLKIIMGFLPSDTGEVILAKDKTIGYLAQHQELDGNHSIYEEVKEAKKDVFEMEKQLRWMEEEMRHTSGENLETMYQRYAQLNQQFESADGYSCESEIIGVLKGLGFQENEFSKKTNTLSGGQKTRVSLGKLLLSKPDILLLDEPTNHLDMDSIHWLENYLINYAGSIIIVCHDRYFLDKVVTKIIEIDQKRVTVFQGNYTAYSEKKQQLMDTLMKQYMNQQREVKHQEAVIEKLRSFNREKSIRRAESREKMLNKIEMLEKPKTDEALMRIRLEPNIQSGNDVLTVKELSKSFGSQTLFEHLNFEIKRGERVAIIGNNGTGKTTILKIINQLIDADSGQIQLGSRVHIGYYDQEHHVLHMDKTIFQEISDEYPRLTNTEIRNLLAAFLFTGDDVFKPIHELSGGERGRVSLAKLMLSDSNFLILDEPTNHLDIMSREILENALNRYTGTLLYVSHDRFFINRTATRILELTNQTLINYIGNYDYYLEKKDLMTSLALTYSATEDKNASNSEAKQDWNKQREEQSKMRKRKNELKRIEDSIAQTEQQIADITELLDQEEVYTDVPRLLKLNKEKENLEIKLEDLYEHWGELSD